MSVAVILSMKPDSEELNAADKVAPVLRSQS